MALQKCIFDLFFFYYFYIYSDMKCAVKTRQSGFCFVFAITGMKNI